ncbi:lysophospholipid acyltransferase family protein [Henriciella aquimarina]|uniref:lysophospholipid acyltransferase family protein n=1 Tax=Henriciella aquimarina TaxID=545261 RepID=UPI0009FD54CE|nr:1-acyl-sn-glycerol-3-phosphate acyltransferase [Henriciella aquimarina]
MARGIAFTAVYYLVSFVYVICALPTLVLPGRGATTAVIRSYTRAMRICLRVLAGIKVDVRGRENLPEGSFILAAKHQSWGDGFLIYPEVKNLTFVTGDHLERFPFVGRLLQKLGAIVIDTCGGGERKAASLAEGLQQAKGEGRRILIYPEGHLAPPGYHFRYKPGVWHMQKAMNAPVVPVATNLGCFWQQEDIRKQPGTAIIEFLPPIETGLSKEAFLARLTEMIEKRSAELLAEATGEAVTETRLLPDPDKADDTTHEPAIVRE